MINHLIFLLDYITLGRISKCGDRKKIKTKIEVEPKLCKIIELLQRYGSGDAGFSLCGGLVKTTKSLSAFYAGLFLLSGGWLAKCLVLTAAQFFLFSACAVT